MVLAQLVDWSLSIPEVRGSNPVIGNIYWKFVNLQLYWKYENKEKRGREWPIWKKTLESSYGQICSQCDSSVVNYDRKVLYKIVSCWVYKIAPKCCCCCCIRTNFLAILASQLPPMHESKGANSEPKLFRKNTLLQRTRATRHTVRLIQDHAPGKVLKEISKLTRSILRNTFFGSKLPAVWPDLTKFCYYGKILIVFGVYFVLRKNSNILLAKLLCYWANFQCCKWSNIEK